MTTTRERWFKRWRVTVGLLALGVIPVLAGGHRVAELASRPVVTDANARVVHAPVPVAVHIVAVTVFALGGAFQFAPNRGRHLRAHRGLGAAVTVTGVLAALSGLWMTHAYRLPPSDNALLGVIRDVVGVAMLAFLVLGAVAVAQRRYRAHGAWTTRAYAVGMGAGTQPFTHLPWIVAFGAPSAMPRAFLMLAGWVVNAAVAEHVIRRRRRVGHDVGGDHGARPVPDARPNAMAGALPADVELAGRVGGARGVGARRRAAVDPA